MSSVSKIPENPPNSRDLAARGDLVVFAIPPVDATILESFGTSALHALIVGGKKYAEIAQMLGIAPSSLSMWIHNLPTADRDAMRTARQVSAEALLDHADAVLDAPFAEDEPMSSATVALRIARAASARTRAGLRNAAYREKAPIDADSPAAVNTTPSVHISITLPDSADRERYAAIINGRVLPDTA